MLIHKPNKSDRTCIKRSDGLSFGPWVQRGRPDRALTAPPVTLQTGTLVVDVVQVGAVLVPSRHRGLSQPPPHQTAAIQIPGTTKRRLAGYELLAATRLLAETKRLCDYSPPYQWPLIKSQHSMRIGGSKLESVVFYDLPPASSEQRNRGREKAAGGITSPHPIKTPTPYKVPSPKRHKWVRAEKLLVG